MLNSLLLTLLGLLPVSLAASHPRDFSLPAPSVFVRATNPQCYTNPKICAEVMIGDRVNQQLGDNGCQVILNPDQVTGIRAFACKCTLYNSADSGSCNSGVDETIDRLAPCDVVTRKERRWKHSPNFWSCYVPAE